MPMISSELSDFKKQKTFQVYGFLCGILAVPNRPKFIRRVWIHSFARRFCIHCVFLALKNAFASFQLTFPLLFDELKDAIKAWIDGFSLHAKTKDELLHHVGQFSPNCKKHKSHWLAKNCSIYAKKMKWCGCIIENNGSHLDSCNL